jgi:DNA recombination-dependent growth factor C
MISRGWFMGLLQGALSLRRFLALGPVPSGDDLCGGLAKERYRPFRDGTEEERCGWVDWRNPLVAPADPDWVFQGRFAVFALRIDTRRVPPMLLKAHTDLRIQSLMKEKDLAFLGREARISLQDEVKAELLRQVLPTPRIVEIAWDLKDGLLWTTAGNAKAQGHLTGLCMKSFGVELQPLVPLLLAGRLAPGIPAEALAALEPFALGGAGA